MRIARESVSAWNAHDPDRLVLPFESALRSHAVRLTGPRALVHAFPAWLLLSHFAAVPRPALRAG